MTPEERIAEVLATHHRSADDDEFWCVCGRWCNDDDAPHSAHVAAAVVAAVRSWPPDQQAALTPEAAAKAWDEGHAAGWGDGYSDTTDPLPNPYRPTLEDKQP